MQTLYDGPGGIRIVRTTHPGEAQDLIGVLSRIAADLSWQPGTQLEDCRKVAQHLAVTVDGATAGGLQVVFGGGAMPLPCRRVWPEAEVGDEAGTAHVTILALREEFRGRPHLFGSLCVELWRCCVDAGVERIVIEATPPTLRLYRRIGWPLEVVGDLRVHWGEECYLCRMGVREVAEALSAKALRSASYRALVEQASRDGFAVPFATGSGSR